MIPHVNHHAYILPGIVDGAVVKAQAERRRDRQNEVTVVHDHHAEAGTSTARPGVTRLNNCLETCLIYEPGYQTRPVGAFRENFKIQEEQE